MLTLAVSKDTKSEIYRQSLAIREEVFIIEQDISSELEIEGEENSIYFLLFSINQPVATARLKIKKDIGKLQRVAVLKQFRGLGMGREIIFKIEQWARENQLQKLILGAQITAIGFYEKLGYQVCSDIYLEANILHKNMEKIIYSRK